MADRCAQRLARIHPRHAPFSPRHLCFSPHGSELLNSLARSYDSSEHIPGRAGEPVAKCQLDRRGTQADIRIRRCLPEGGYYRGDAAYHVLWTVHRSHCGGGLCSLLEGGNTKNDRHHACRNRRYVDFNRRVLGHDSCYRGPGISHPARSHIAELESSSEVASSSCHGNSQGTQSPYHYKQSRDIQGCTGTVALTVNVVIGDSIVWWRAWVLWADSRIVRCVCVVMILLTMLTGAMDTGDACGLEPHYIFTDSIGDSSSFEAPPGLTSNSGTMFTGDVWGFVAVFSSLFTNVIATILIGYRGWQHRRFIMSYLRESSPRTQVERTLALLVESGLLYCALWVVIAVYAYSDQSPLLQTRTPAFANFYYVMSSCLVPLVGMYPTLIIIVCAVEKSLNEKLADEHCGRISSPMFDPQLEARRCGSLSELVSTSSAYAAQDGSTSSAH
ncbi:hypothetical protein L226DRAFT_395986 [Lentinus tigrinus ALCF2SS1-7]|uniref:uncharacterized protein n=1 Tax=Lentinus tigrinus ALCF2SS1-7 TaxID=1328758 RepID=UPI001166181B|nr:hypothetical protein L226DRAFT_395986 [Lentinus tigrinus ALCF2SS1-7]